MSRLLALALALIPSFAFARPHAVAVVINQQEFPGESRVIVPFLDPPNRAKIPAGKSRPLVHLGRRFPIGGDIPLLYRPHGFVRMKKHGPRNPI